jgi:hypothetical protein
MATNEDLKLAIDTTETTQDAFMDIANWTVCVVATDVL